MNKLIGIAIGAISIVTAITLILYQAPITDNLDRENEQSGASINKATICTNGDFVAEKSKDVIEINMDAYQWRFSYCSITVYKGQSIVLNLKSLDVPHGFAIDGYPEEGSVYITPDSESKFTFVAKKTGSFTYYCTVFCGEGHPLHRGELIVMDR